MAITLHQLRKRIAHCTIDIGDDEHISIEYRPHAITPGYLDSVAKENDLMSLAKTVAEFVADWDIEEEEGIKLPVSVDGAAQLGIQLLNLIIQEVASHMRDPLAVKKTAKR